MKRSRIARDEAATLLAAHASVVEMRTAIRLLREGRGGEAERAVRALLHRDPRNAAALCLIGDLARRNGIHAEAERFFRAALAVVPGAVEVELALAAVLRTRDGACEAIALYAGIVDDLPEHVEAALAQATLQGQVGNYDDASAVLEALAIMHGEVPQVHLALGNIRATMGDVAGSMSAFHYALTLDETAAEAWWGLANLKIYRFPTTEVDRMAASISRIGESRPRAIIQFALAKALADDGASVASFARYAAANASWRRMIAYDRRRTEGDVDAALDFFTPERMEELAKYGHDSDEPIFIVGMPRSGSTLIEQILASHSAVEGTAELPYIPMLVHRLLEERWRDTGVRFPRVLDDLSPVRFRDLAQTYLDAASVHRREGKRFFIDKLPNNWLYVGFIRTLFPNATIIDSRRNAMDCCWSNYCQWYARGQEFSYDLEELGHYYVQYRRMMAHAEVNQRMRIERVDHEALLADPTAGIAALLARVGLDAEPACFRFHENARAVRTASAQQVRRPIQAPVAPAWLPHATDLAPLRAIIEHSVGEI